MSPDLQTLSACGRHRTRQAVSSWQHPPVATAQPRGEDWAAGVGWGGRIHGEKDRPGGRWGNLSLMGEVLIAAFTWQSDEGGRAGRQRHAGTAPAGVRARCVQTQPGRVVEAPAVRGAVGVAEHDAPPARSPSLKKTKCFI